MYKVWEDCKHLHKIPKYKIFVPEMLLTYVSKIFDPLSLSVKLHICNFFCFLLSTIVIMLWPKLLIETKERKINYKFVNMNVMVLQDPFVLICENCSKNCDCFNPLSI